MASFRAENNNSVPVFPMLSKHVHFQGMACWTKSIAKRTLKSSTLYVFCFNVIPCIAATVGSMQSCNVLPLGLASRSNFGTGRTNETTSFYMLGLDMRFHVKHFSRSKVALQTEPLSSIVPPNRTEPRMFPIDMLLTILTKPAGPNLYILFCCCN